MPQTTTIGKVRGIALRSRKKGPMIVVEDAEAVPNGKLVGDIDCEPHRGITLISAQQWADVVREMGRDLPWHTRRANILVDSGSLGELIGRTIAVGEVRVEVSAETHGCAYMDELAPGLRAALKPDFRAGIYGRIAKGGRIRVGDVVTTEPPCVLR